MQHSNNNEQRIRNSLILHLRPARVPARAIRFTHTCGLGGMALVLIILMFATGLLMMFAYEPSPERAYLSIVALQEDVLFGRLVRSVHHWSASLLIVVALLHLLRVFLTGAFRVRRRRNWLIGLGLLFCILLSGFTGYLLPWDQTSYWAITICTEMLAQVPGVGHALQQVMIGGDEIGAATLVNFYALHVAVTPIMLFALMMWHFWRIRLAGGVVLPSVPHSKSAGADETVPFIPNLLVREVTVALVLIAFVLVLAILAEAPLGEPANPGLSPNPAKAPWYFLGFQELLLHFNALFAVLVIPLMVVIGLVSLPYLRFDADLSGDWFLTSKGRRMAAVAAGTAIIATPLWVVADEFLAGAAGWLPGSAPVISSGLLPFAILSAALAGYYVMVKRFFMASRNEAVQALFVLLFVAFSVLTVIGVWFRGAGMALVWPWQI